jgi:hypothetical protein
MPKIGIKKSGEFIILITSNKIISHHICNNSKCKPSKIITTLQAPTFKSSRQIQRISILSGTQAIKTTIPHQTARPKIRNYTET